MNKIKTHLIIIIIVFSINSVSSQERGSVSGIVKDKTTQALLEGINVKILGTNLGAVTETDGSFSVNGIPTGKYNIEFSDIAYQTYIESEVIVMTGMERRLTIELNGISVDEVLVETTRFQKPIDATTSYKSLSFEEIRKAPGGFEDIGRVIQSLPGLAVTNDGRNDIQVRGGSPSENLFIVDGFKINNFNHFGSQGATGGPVSIINLDFINKVEFITGGFSAKYGDRLSSVTNIELRDGNPDHFFGKINLSGTGLGANFEGPLPFRNKGSWLVAARRSYLDLIFNAAGFSFVPEYTDFQAKLNYDISKNNFLEITSFGAIDKVRFNNEDEENKQNNERILTTNQNSYAAGIIWKTLISENSFAEFSIGRNFVKYFYSKRDSLFNETFKNDSREGDVSLKAEYVNKLASTTFLSVGLTGETIKLQYDIDKKADTTLVTDPETGNRIIIPGILINKNIRTAKASAYAELIWNIFHRFKISTGIRADHFNLITEKNNISPRLSVSTKLTDILSLNLAYGIFYQSPSYIWITGIEKNKELKNIRADHYIAGLELYPDKDTKVSLEGYFKDYSNYPVSTVRPWLILANNSGFDSQNSFGLEPLESSGKGKTYGLELFIQKALSNNYYGSASISIGEAKYSALDGIERPSDYDNRVIVNFTGGYLFGRDWEINAKFRFATGRPYTPIDPSNGFIKSDEYNTLRLPSYHRLDIRAEKRFNFSKWSLITYLDIQNIYNKKNVSQYRWDPFKKEIVEDKNLGILPTIGVSAEF